MSPALAGGFFTINTTWEALNLYLFIYFWLFWVSTAAHGLSLIVASGGYSSSWCPGFSLCWLLSWQSTSSVVVVHRLSCSAACRIFPDQGLPMSPAFTGRVLSTVLPGKSSPSNLTLQRRGLRTELQFTTGSHKAFMTVHKLSRDKSHKYINLAGRAPMISKNVNKSHQ